MALPLPQESLDRQVALSRVGGDLELLKEIAVLFVDDYPQSLADLHAAAARGDAKAVERAAHGLKGSVANFGAAAAFEAARRIEEFGRAQRLAEVEPMLAKLELALAALRVELEAL
ncbi:MAG TPA: Hpt domain-containing protein [Bryobacteraceae bacterium]|nr:Hpt domain-containing protein [Bryobacteraceae bacterium]